MKKTILLGIVLVLGFQIGAIAQNKETANQKKITEGVIIYDLKLDGGAQDGMMAAMIPTELVIKFKGTKSRSEFVTGMSETVAITDSKDDKSAVVLLDFMGSKYAMKIDEKKIMEQRAAMPKYEIVDSKETKQIAGYNCTKAYLINKETNEEVIVYYTTEIPFAENSFNAEFRGVKGMPMEYVAKMQNVKMSVTVREIKKEKIQDSIFAIPTDYKQVTQEELMKELSGGE